MTNQQNLEERLIQERWDLILEIYTDNIEGPFSDFEKKYGQRLDQLGVQANKFTGNSTASALNGTREHLEWYLGQFREICKDKRNADEYMQRALAVEPGSSTFFFGSREFFGQNLHSLFVQTDGQREQQVEDFKRRYSVNRGWQDANSFPGNLIYSDFRGSDRRSYEGAKVALLMRAKKPNGLLQGIVGTVTIPYVQIDGRVGAVFELELETGEKNQYNSNDIKEMRAQEQGEKTYYSITSELKNDGFVLYLGHSLIPAGSELAVINGHPASKSFDLINYTMTRDRDFGTGSLATFEVLRGAQLTQLNINDLGNRLYVRTLTTI